MTAPISIAYEDWVAVIDDANKAQERVKKLEAALKFYAHRGHWMTDGLGSEPVSHIDLDGGDIARKALEE